MICIRCKNDAKYKDRVGGNCPTCHHRFAFEPKSGDRLTDGAFASALAKVSSDGKVRWNKENLYYEVARRLTKRSFAGMIGLGAMAVFCTVVTVLAKHPAPAIPGLIFWILTLIQAARYFARTIVLEPGVFEGLFRKWVAAHGEPAALIVRKASPPAAATRALPADIPEYSFDRAVICDRSETVDLLLANNFHFENNCAVLSEGGYPQTVFKTVLAMLKKNPKLIVYALHDATPHGCDLARRLSTSPEWFEKGARVIDVGLRPRHAQPFKGYWSDAVPGAPSGRNADETWLASYSLALGVLRPEQVIKRLFRAISNTPDAFAEGLSVDAAAFSSEATVSDGGGDSFG